MDPTLWIRDQFYRLSDAIYTRIDRQTSLRRFGLRLLLTVIMAAHRYRRTQGGSHATALAYRTLLALVPIMALLITAVTSLVSNPETLNQRLFDHLMPSSGQVVSGYITEFSRQASAIGAISLALFVVTAISLVMNIESAMNDLWHIRADRDLLVKIGAYGALLIAGPILIAISVYLSNHLLNEFISKSIFGSRRLPYWFSYGLSLLFTLSGFFLLYYKLPNTRVSLSAATIGAVIGGGTWELAKHLFDWYISQVVTYHVIYGSLSVIPLFLLWLYLSWVITLWGSQVTYIWQNLPTLKSRSVLEPLTEWDKVNLAIRTLVFLAERYLYSSGPVHVERLMDAQQADRYEIREILNTLCAADFLILTQEHPETCILARSPGEISLYEVIALFDDFTPGPSRDRDDKLEEEISAIGTLIQDGMRTRLKGLTLNSLIDTESTPQAAEESQV